MSGGARRAAWRVVLDAASIGSRSPPARGGGRSREELLERTVRSLDLSSSRWSPLPSKQPIRGPLAASGEVSGRDPTRRSRDLDSKTFTGSLSDPNRRDSSGNRTNEKAPPSTSWSDAGWTWGSCATLPNAISLSRALASPVLFHAISREHWELSAGILAFGALSDWADGASARYLDGRRERRERSSGGGDASLSSPSSTSPLGTYLDPLADKVFIGAAVAAAAGWGGGGGELSLGGGEAAAAVDDVDDDESVDESTTETKRPASSSKPLLPSWLAAAIVGRDAFLVCGSLYARLRQFGGRWPGGPEFFRLKEKASLSSSPAPAAAPRVRPLFVSKVNTALQFATIGAAVADSGGWLDVAMRKASTSSSPSTAADAAAAAATTLAGSDVVAALAAATAAMTAASGLAYTSEYFKRKRGG